jgi:hypothetical protein
MPVVMLISGTGRQSGDSRYSAERATRTDIARALLAVGVDGGVTALAEWVRTLPAQHP